MQLDMKKKGQGGYPWKENLILGSDFSNLYKEHGATNCHIKKNPYSVFITGI